MHEISINNCNFLWMTRGEKWEFRFLSKCSLLASAVETVYKAVFLHDHDESRFGYWKGYITVAGAQKPYVACRCYDSTVQRDDAKRRIPHEFLLLCSEEEYTLLNGVAWESLILDQVRKLYAERYPCSADEVTDCLIDFSIPLNPGIAANESCVTLDISIPQSPPKTHPQRHPFIGISFALILIGCCCAGYLLCGHSQKLPRGETLWVPATWEGTDMLEGTGVSDECKICYYNQNAGEKETKTTPVPVPHGWLEENAVDILETTANDYEATAWGRAANGRPVWACYLAGVSPTNKTAAFKVKSFEFVDGRPIVKWDSDLNEDGTKEERLYEVEGAETLGGAWGPTNAASRFFRVKVALP